MSIGLKAIEWQRQGEFLLKYRIRRQSVEGQSKKKEAELRAKSQSQEPEPKPRGRKPRTSRAKERWCSQPIVPV